MINEKITERHAPDREWKKKTGGRDKDQTKISLVTRATGGGGGDNGLETRVP